MGTWTRKLRSAYTIACIVTLAKLTPTLKNTPDNIFHIRFVKILRNRISWQDGVSSVFAATAELASFN